MSLNYEEGKPLMIFDINIKWPYFQNIFKEINKQFTFKYPHFFSFKNPPKTLKNIYKIKI